MMQGLAERIERLSIPEPNTGCHLWMGHMKANGYGTLGVKIDGVWKTQHAHRVSFECLVGIIPAGLDLDHICRNRACVNPLHLEPVTRSENLGRSPMMGRSSDKIACPKGHPYSGTNARGQRICHACAADATARYRSTRSRP